LEPLVACFDSAIPRSQQASKQHRQAAHIAAHKKSPKKYCAFHTPAQIRSMYADMNGNSGIKKHQNGAHLQFKLATPFWGPASAGRGSVGSCSSACGSCLLGPLSPTWESQQRPACAGFLLWHACQPRCDDTRPIVGWFWRRSWGVGEKRQKPSSMNKTRRARLRRWPSR